MTAPTPGRRRVRPSRLALLVFLALVLAEVFTLKWLSGLIGGWPTFLVVLALSAAGLAVIVHGGGKARHELGQAMAQGRTPERELADGLFVMIGGFLLFLPGVVSGLIGLLLVVPVTRRPLRNLVLGALNRFTTGKLEVIRGEQVVTVDRVDPNTPDPHAPSGPAAIEGVVIESSDERRERGPAS